MPSARTSISDVLVGRAKRDARLGERAPRAHAERRHEVDDVGDLRRGRAAPRRPRAPPSGSPCAMSWGKLSIGSWMNGRARAAAGCAAGDDAPVDRPGDALLRVEVPARAALEPCPLRRREFARVARALRSTTSPGSASRRGESSRSNRGRSGSSPKRSSIICGSTITRRPLSSGSRSLASSPRTSMPPRDAGPSFSKRARRRIASRSAVGAWPWQREEAGRREHRARPDGARVEHRDCERATGALPCRLHLQPVLDAPGHRGHRLGEPRVDPRGDRACARPCARTADADRARTRRRGELQRPRRSPASSSTPTARPFLFHG